MLELSLLEKIVIFAFPILFAVTVHEVAHGWVASKLGDPTAKSLGRLTLNPIKHIDLIGTIIVPVLLLVAGGFLFGWAKPVPVNWQNLRRPRRDMALVAAAGPFANFIMALIWALIAKISLMIALATGNQHFLLFFYMGSAGIMINILLMIFNLIPIPPLDGSRVVASYLKGKAAFYYNQIEPYGFFILLALIVSGGLFFIIGKPIDNLFKLIATIFGLPN